MKCLNWPLTVAALCFFLTCMYAQSKSSIAQYDFELAQKFAELGQHQDAVSTYDAAIKQDDSFFLAYIMRGMSYRKLRMFDAAQSDFNTAKLLDPSSFKPYMCLAMLEYDRGNFLESLYMIDICHKKGGMDGTTLLLRGMSKWALRDSQGACVDFQSAFDWGYEGAYEYIVKYCR